jgi:hypothetical protein
MDIILTGVARSGTTLSCSLLNQLPQCVALHEPMNPAELSGLEFPQGYMSRVGEFFASQRASLMASGVAVTKGADGRVPDNPFGSVRESSGLRMSTVTAQEVNFGKRLEPGFRLVMKHPNLFTATLGALREKYPCYAIVRNPLASLLSWHSVNAPVNSGRLPFGEAFDPALKAALEAQPDRLERQLTILRWYFDQYSSLLPRHHVIRYEDIVATGGSALGVIDPAASQLAAPLRSRNRSLEYDASIVRPLAERVLSAEPAYCSFYRASEVTSLRDAWLAGAG